MRETWTIPHVEVQEFVANEYVAACYDYQAELYCAIPGDNLNYVNDGTKTGIGPRDGLHHGGPCTTNNSCNVKGHTGMENSTGHAITNVKIGEAASSGLRTYVTSSIGSQPSELKDGYYKATWTNYDDAGLEYYHYGIAKVSSVIQVPGRPNHS